MATPKPKSKKAPSARRAVRLEPPLSLVPASERLAVAEMTSSNLNELCAGVVAGWRSLDLGSRNETMITMRRQSRALAEALSARAPRRKRSSRQLSPQMLAIPEAQRTRLHTLSPAKLMKLCRTVFPEWPNLLLSERQALLSHLREESRALASRAGLPAKKVRHLLSRESIAATACGLYLAELPPGAVATFVKNVTCEACKATPAHAAGLRAWAEADPAPALEQRVAGVLELIEDLAARASVVAIHARADARDAARPLTLALEELERWLRNGGVAFSLNSFLRAVRPEPAFPEEPSHEQA